MLPVAVERSLMESSGIGFSTAMMVVNADWMDAGPCLNSALRKAPNDFLKLKLNFFKAAHNCVSSLSWRSRL